MNLMKYRKLYFAFSLIVILPGLYSLARWGVKPSIDFVGGSLIEIRSSNPSAYSYDRLIELGGESIGLSSVQAVGENKLLLKAKEISNQEKDQFLSSVKETDASLEELRFETVGPTLSKELLSKTFAAIALVSLIIMSYVWRQFHNVRYGLTAIAAMFHDSLVLLGSFSLLGHFYGVEVDVLFVTAMLTTLSFSVHDTIVVFDRIRELKRVKSRVDFASLANAAVLETLSRSINNSVTIIIMLLALSLLGGSTIKWFATALLIGAITGTYSSTFTAVPLLLEWEKRIGNKK